MPQPRIAPLTGVPRRYDWGSPTAIPNLLGVEPDGSPVAELWFGAHPDDPSGVDGSDIALDAMIAADPDTALGAEVIDRFGPRLPFLLKVLAADKALSIQVHPDLAQARAGFADEDAAGIARTAPDRNYRDANHKPELICALTRFEALCGFRPVAQTLALLDELDLPELAFLAERLRGPDPLRAAFTAVLTHDDPARLVAAVAARAGADGALRPVHLAVHDFPGDIGAVLALLLNYVVLEPGEAIYLGAGNVHAYLRGTGVEIMASSDNVLRCGLTPKHVDVAELLRITDFRELAEPRWPATDGTFAVPVPDFRLTRVTGRTEVAGPAIVLCTEGSATIGTDEIVRPGRAVFVDAGAAVPSSVLGTAFVASVGTACATTGSGR